MIKDTGNHIFVTKDRKMNKDIKDLIGKKVYYYSYCTKKIYCGEIVSAVETVFHGKKLSYEYARFLPEVFIQIDDDIMAIVSSKVHFSPSGEMDLDAGFAFTEDELKKKFG